MRKYLSSVIICLFAAQAAFAFSPALKNVNLREEAKNSADANDIGSLDNILLQSAAQRGPKGITGTFMPGSFSEDSLVRPASVNNKDTGLKAEFYLAKEKGPYGRIDYKITHGPKISKVNVADNVTYVYGPCNDPHAPMSVNAIIEYSYKNKNKEEKKTETVKVLVVSKYQIGEASTYSQDYQVSDFYENIDSYGDCKKCGEKVHDIYHHDVTCTGAKDKTVKPASKASSESVQKAPAAKKDTCADCGKEIEGAGQHCSALYYNRLCSGVKEKEHKYTYVPEDHKPDCKNHYHCDCPAKE
jgi:hypothetical protein